MTEIIDRRHDATPAGDGWNELSEYPWFNEFITEGVSDEVRQGLKDEIASINEDEQRDYANPHQISRKHTKEEYDRFRQEATAKVLRKVEPEPSVEEPASVPVPEDLQQSKLREEEISKLLLNEDGTRKKEYESSANGDQELKVENDIDDWNKELNEKVRRGEISKEEAYRQQDERLEAAISEIDKIRNEEYERQRQEQMKDLSSVFQQILANKKESENHPTPAEPAPVEPAPTPAPLQPEPKPLPLDPIPAPVEPISAPAPILEPTPKPAPTPAPAESAPTPNRDQSLDSNDKKPNDSEIDDEKAKRVEELKRQLEENEKRLAADKKEMDEAMKELEKIHLPVVVNMMDEVNATDLAWNLAEQDLQKEIENAGKVGRFLKGKLFRKRYLKRYIDEYIGSYKNGKLGYKSVGESGRSIYQVADDYNHASLELAYDLAARTSQDNVSSEGSENIEIAEADSKKNADIIKNVMDYCMARRNLKDDESSYELEKNLREKLSAIVKTEDRWLLSEYIKNADQAYRLLELGIPIEQVTERFKTYNARIIDTRPESERFDINQIFARINYNSGDRAA